jgi:D-alanyl-lipoteichoic acid acyltransferase DltB (MBOAT superfamily)
MSFLSPEFGLFVVAGLGLFLGCAEAWRSGVLLALSVAFYLTYVPADGLLLLGSAALVHVAALAIDTRRSDRARLRLAWAVAAVLVASLAFFKCLPLMGPGSWIVPLGLSYYFFKLLGYLLDVYWGKIAPRRSLADVLLYASFFPQIVSGPIQRAGDFFGQLDRLPRPKPSQVAAGLRRILLGLFKKLVIAQRLALIVDPVHENPSGFSSLELLLGAYCFAWQLYADFSGLTDIAIGIGQMFGITGPENFEFPFYARNLQDYWRRWHMSLTSWLGDYLFQPLRLSLRRWVRVGLAAAILINMVAIGVWHGPRWTYAAFGAIHGVMLAVSALTLKSRNGYFRRHPEFAGIRAVVGPVVTFHLVVLPMIVFRSDSVASALVYFRNLVPGLAHSDIPALRVGSGFLHFNPATLLLIVVAIVVAELADGVVRRGPATPGPFWSAPRAFRWAIYYAGVAVVFLSAYSEQKFFYAQF